ncbi:MAG TPA: hypothetical protein VF384_16850 [Planctomycetota bacterium]
MIPRTFSERAFMILAIAALLAATASAQRVPLGDEVLDKLLRQYDKDKDGKVQKSEYPRTAEAFANLDRDRNGVLDAADFEPGALRRPMRDPRGPEDKDKLPKVGSVAPDFELPLLGSKETVRLSSLRGKLPVALIFGSYT